jgi:hypothetical protein
MYEGSSEENYRMDVVAKYEYLHLYRVIKKDCLSWQYN